MNWWAASGLCGHYVCAEYMWGQLVAICDRDRLSEMELSLKQIIIGDGNKSAFRFFEGLQIHHQTLRMTFIRMMTAQDEYSRRMNMIAWLAFSPEAEEWSPKDWKLAVISVLRDRALDDSVPKYVNLPSNNLAKTKNHRVKTQASKTTN